MNVLHLQDILYTSDISACSGDTLFLHGIATWGGTDLSIISTPCSIIYWVKHHIILCAISDSHGDHIMGQGVMSDGDDDRKPMLQHLYHPDQMHHHHVMQDDHHQDFGIPLPPTKPKLWSLTDTTASKNQMDSVGRVGHQSSPGFTMPITSRRCRHLSRLTSGKLEICHVV